MRFASKIAIREIIHFLEKNATIKQVFIVCFDMRTFKFYDDELNKQS
jgi:hypothetical protein